MTAFAVQNRMEVVVLVGAMRPEAGYIHSSRANSLQKGATLRQVKDDAVKPKLGISVTQTIAVGPTAEGFCVGENKAKLRWEKHMFDMIFPKDESAEVQDARLAKERKVRMSSRVL